MNFVRQRLHKPDYQIIIYVGLLMLLGLIIMYAIGPQRANVLNESNNTSFYTSTYFVIKQSFSLLLALLVFGVMTVIPLDFLKKSSVILLVTGLAACVLLFITGNLLHLGVAKCSLGACRWFNLGPLGSFQPAEMLKFGLLAYLAGFIGMRYQQGLINDKDKTLIPMLIVVSVSLIFTIILQKDMGTGIAISSLFMSMLLVSGIKWKTIGMVVMGALLCGILLVLVAPHRMERVKTFFGSHSSSTSAEEENDANYHIKHAMLAIGSGGFLGVGIGNSVQATGYLPEAINDSVFAIMGETFGFIGLVLILGLFSALLFRILKVSDYLVEPWHKLFAAGVFGWLFAHVVLNVASMIGVFPLTGITLPLLSFGGTSMIFIAAALGVVFQLSKHTSHIPIEINQEVNYENYRSRRGVRGSRNSSRRSYKTN